MKSKKTKEDFAHCKDPEFAWTYYQAIQLGLEVAEANAKLLKSIPVETTVEESDTTSGEVE